jgi:hypothetical protein
MPHASVAERRAGAGEPAVRSARFAHPPGRDQAAGSLPRPGVSYISSARQDSQRRVSRPALPQVPRIESADRTQRPPAVRAERLARQPVNQARLGTLEPRRPEPRVERAAVARPAMRNPVRSQPIQRESPRPFVPQPRAAQPRYQPPPRAQPQRAAAPRVKASRQSESRQERKSDRQKVGQRQ